MALFYADGEAVERFDVVEFRRDGDVLEGTVTALFQKSARVMVRYPDHTDTRKDGAPKMKSTSVPVAEVALLARDG